MWTESKSEKPVKQKALLETVLHEIYAVVGEGGM